MSLVLMSASNSIFYIFQMKEREQEEFESFIPFCFRAFADNIGSSLKVTKNYLLLS